ncbi:hypothetical protein ACFLQ1_02530 [Candidatus Auribacterota bacterium]
MRQLKVVSIIGLLGFLGLTINSLYIIKTRTPAEFVINWGFNGPGRLILKSLVRKGEKSLPELRKLTLKAKPYIAAKAAVKLAEWGTPEIDVSILIKALKRTRTCRDEYVAKDIEDALRKLSKLDLPKNSPADVWQKKWTNIRRTPEGGVDYGNK